MRLQLKFYSRYFILFHELAKTNLWNFFILQNFSVQTVIYKEGDIMKKRWRGTVVLLAAALLLGACGTADSTDTAENAGNTASL